MNTDIVRVVRILEYVGPEKALKHALAQNAVHGIRRFGDITVREATLPNWEVVGEKPVEHGDDIIIWPDGTYCERRELGGYNHMGDDYQVLWTDTGTWIAFVNRDPGPVNKTYFAMDMCGTMVPDPDGQWVRR